MTTDPTLLPGRLLRRAGPPKPVAKFQGVQIDDPRLADVLSPDADIALTSTKARCTARGRSGSRRATGCSGRTCRTGGCSPGIRTAR